jgi:hypothetical protein
MRFGETFERNYRKIVLTGTIGQKTNFKFCRAHLLILSISYTGASIDASGTIEKFYFRKAQVRSHLINVEKLQLQLEDLI